MYSLVQQNSSSSNLSFRSPDRLVKCNELIIAVTKFEEFSSIERPEIDPDRNPQFRPGNPGDIILVRVLYNYNFITPGLGTALVNQTGTSIKPIISNIVFRNEPL